MCIKFKDLIKKVNIKSDSKKTDTHELVTIFEMTEKLSLIPIETNINERTLLVLGVKGNLFNLSFAMLRKIYALYITGKIDREYFVQVG